MARLSSRARFSVLAIGLAVAAGTAVWSTHSSIVRADSGAAATAAPATAPSTQAATKPAADAKADEVTAAAKGTIDLRLDLDAVLAPVDPFEAKIRTKVYQGELPIIAVAGQGDKVKKGDLILAIDPKLLKRQLASAEDEMANLQAASDKHRPTPSSAKRAMRSNCSGRKMGFATRRTT